MIALLQLVSVVDPGTVAASLTAAVAGAGLVRERRRGAVRAELVVRACHEVRGPLTAAHLALHGLRRRGVRVAAVEDELWRVARALGDLAAAPAGQSALEAPEPVDVGALLRRQTAGWRRAARAQGRELVLREPDDGLLVHADRLRLAQATANLIANALEHGSGRVEVSVLGVGTRVAVEVLDEGPGLAMPLKAITARARAGRGTRGRGLAIASEIATRHGGCIVTAPAAHGARLVLELPAWRPVAPAVRLPAS